MTFDLSRSIPVRGLTGPGTIGGIGSPDKTSTPAGGESFGEILKGYIDGVGRLEKAADAKVEGVLEGSVTDPHEVMLAVQEANLALDMMIEIRNKLLDAYRELSRTSV